MECRKCLREKPLEEFHWTNKTKGQRKTTCKACANAVARQRVKEKYQQDPDRYRKSQKLSRERRRKKVIAHYGGKCVCCGEIKYEFLSIDHIDGGGTKHRAKIGANIDRWLIKNNYPLGYQVLCHNCNFSLGMYGYCPHNKQH